LDAVRMMYLLKRFVADPQIRMGYLSKLGVFNGMPDEKYLKKKFKLCMGKELDLENPKTFNEKLQWLKLYNRKPEYTRMVCKYESKDYAAKIIGEEHTIPTYGLYHSFDEIDFDILPNQFVLKTTHDSGGVVICTDREHMGFSSKEKNGLTLNEVRYILEASLKRNYYWSGREWPYKDVKPRIIAEELLKEANGAPARDYKVLCFNGEPRLVEVILNRFTDDYTQDFYTEKWEKTDIQQNNTPRSNIALEKPKWVDEMFELSRRLAKGHPHLRCDWYYVNGRFYIGELTLFEASGFGKFTPEEWDYTLGDWITLPEKRTGGTAGKS